jgi:hypothetical protein
MCFNLYQVNFDSKKVLELVTLSETNFSSEINNKIELFFNITSNLYYQKQLGKKGIKNLGDKLRYDSNLKELFTSSNKTLLIKSTGNRMSFLKLFIEGVSLEEYDKIYFLIFTKDLNNLSQIFDKTTTTIGDIESQLNSLKKLTEKLIIRKDLYILEVTSFPNHNFFLTADNFSKIYEKP